jgi:hypothetical protein
MAKIDCRPTIEARITLNLSEDEAAALDALAGYGTDSFLDVFYKNMGRAYLEPHEKGLRSLFESVQRGDAGVGGFLRQAAEARAVFDGRKRAVGRPVGLE